MRHMATTFGHPIHPEDLTHFAQHKKTTGDVITLRSCGFEKLPQFPFSKGYGLQIRTKKELSPF